MARGDCFELSSFFAALTYVQCQAKVRPDVATLSLSSNTFMGFEGEVEVLFQKSRSFCTNDAPCTSPSSEDEQVSKKLERHCRKGRCSRCCLTKYILQLKHLPFDRYMPDAIGDLADS